MLPVVTPGEVGVDVRLVCHSRTGPVARTSFAIAACPGCTWVFRIDLRASVPPTPLLARTASPRAHPTPTALETPAPGRTTPREAQLQNWLRGQGEQDCQGAAYPSGGTNLLLYGPFMVPDTFSAPFSAPRFRPRNLLSW